MNFEQCTFITARLQSNLYREHLSTALANISATTNTLKQSAVTFEVFVLWLCNQCYYTHDVIGIKMTHRNLPYYEGIRTKTCR